MFSTDFIFRQQENLVDNQKCQAGFRLLCNKILLKSLYLDRRLGLLDRRLFLSVSLRSGAAVFGQFFVTCPVSGQFRHFPNLLPSSIFSGDLDFLCFGLLERSGFSSEDLDLFLVFAGSGSPVGSSGVTNFL